MLVFSGVGIFVLVFELRHALVDYREARKRGAENTKIRSDGANHRPGVDAGWPLLF